MYIFIYYYLIVFLLLERVRVYHTNKIINMQVKYFLFCIVLLKYRITFV